MHHLITFSIVFTDKNRVGTLSPPPPIITKVFLPPIITKVKENKYYVERARPRRARCVCVCVNVAGNKLYIRSTRLPTPRVANYKTGCCADFDIPGCNSRAQSFRKAKQIVLDCSMQC